MTLSDLASLGAFVSGVAVLASLALLFFQLRQVSQQVRQTELNQQSLMLQERTTLAIDTFYRQAEPHLRDILPRGRAGDLSLKPEEIDAFLSVTSAVFLTFENSFLQYQLGTLDPTTWSVALVRLKDALSAPGVRAAWPDVRHRFGSAYTGEIDRIMAEVSTSESHFVSRVERWKRAVEQLKTQPAG